MLIAKRLQVPNIHSPRFKYAEFGIAALRGKIHIHSLMLLSHSFNSSHLLLLCKREGMKKSVYEHNYAVEKKALEAQGLGNIKLDLLL